MQDAGIAAPLYITQNDGTVATAAQAVRFPIWSFASGPTNSMRGAAYLSRLQNAVVADVGGTTTDFGHLQAGFPRQANAAVQVGGVRTLFRMPDVLSIGLGGGSLVDRRDRCHRSAQRRLSPDRTGAGIRRRPVDHDRHRRCRGAGGYRRTLAGTAARRRIRRCRAGARCVDGGGECGSHEDRGRRRDADRGRRRRIPGAGPARRRA